MLLQELGNLNESWLSDGWILYRSVKSGCLVRSSAAAEVSWARTEHPNFTAIMTKNRTLFISIYMPDCEKPLAKFLGVLSDLASLLDELWMSDPWHVICIGGDLNACHPSLAAYGAERSAPWIEFANRFMLDWCTLEQLEHDLAPDK